MTADKFALADFITNQLYNCGDVRIQEWSSYNGRHGEYEIASEESLAKIITTILDEYETKVAV